MNTRSCVYICLLLLFNTECLAQRNMPTPPDHRACNCPADEGFQFRFSENKGQWHKNIRYQTHLPAGKLYFEQSGFTYLLMKAEQIKMLHPGDPKQLPFGKMDAHVVRQQFVDASPQARLEAAQPFADPEHYFLGADAANWTHHVRGFAHLTYRNMWPGVDVVVGTDDGQLKYDYRVEAGADVGRIRVRYEGADRLDIKHGRLYVRTSVGDLTEHIPYAYQTVGRQERRVECAYRRIDKHTIGFTFPNGYDPRFPLVIDPVVPVFSTLTGSTADNWGMTATYDNEGNLYSGGIANGAGYPVSSGAFQVAYAGGSPILQSERDNTLYYDCDMAIVKYNATGTERLYSTYIGGRNNEQPCSIIANATGELFIYGITRSDDFPTTAGAYDRSLNGTYADGGAGDIDIVVLRLNADASQLIGSTYVGGNRPDGANSIENPLYYFYADDGRGEIILEGDDQVFVVTTTQSADFPTTANAVQKAFGGGGQDAVVFKLSPDLKSLAWSTFIGGDGDDAGYSVQADQNNNLYLVGGTTSENLPVPTSGWKNGFQGGRSDGFVLQMANDGTRIYAGSYIGTSSYDQVYFVDTDEDNNVYLLGQTEGDMPTFGTKFNQPKGKQFIAKLKPDLTDAEFVLRFGSQDVSRQRCDITMTAFLVDICDNIYVAGWGSVDPSMSPLGAATATGSGNTNGLILTEDAYMKTTTGSDFYLMVLNRNADSLVYATYFGGATGLDHVDGGTSRFDKNGVIYHSVCAACRGLRNDFPVFPDNVVSKTNNSFNCNNGNFKINFNVLNAVQAKFDYDTTMFEGCVPMTVNFHNESKGGDRYLWDFGIDTAKKSTDFEPTYVYKRPGIYKVLLTVQNDFKCNVADSITKYIMVYVQTDAELSADVDPCTRTATFHNTTVDGTTFLWNFGPGKNSTKKDPPPMIFDAPGLYPVRLIVNPGSPCTDTTTLMVRIPDLPDAHFAIDQTPCNPLVRFRALRDTAQHYVEWDFGDGATSTDLAPEHTFTKPGVYKIKLKSFVGLPCSDEKEQQITILPPSVAAFHVNPTCMRTINVVNDCKQAQTYRWDFGEGQPPRAERSPSYTYRKPGTYNVTLITNPDGGACADTARQTLEIRDYPVARFEVQQDLCEPKIHLQDRSLSAYQRMWLIDGQVQDTTLAFDHEFPGPGDYEITLVVNPNDTCAGSETKTIRILPNPKAGFIVSAQQCTREIILTDSSANAKFYLWDFGDGQTADGRNQRHTYLEGGRNYTVRLIANPGTPCADTMTRHVYVPLLPTADFDAKLPGCAREATFRNRTASGKTYFWNFGDGASSALPNPSHSYDNPGRYLVTLLVNPDDTCPARAERWLEVAAAPRAVIAMPDTVCDTTTVLLTTTRNAATYDWYVDNTLFSHERTPVCNLDEARKYLVRLVIDAAEPCPDTSDRILFVAPTPIADFVLDYDRCRMDIFAKDNSINAATIFWMASDGAHSKAPTFSRTFRDTGAYQLTLTANPGQRCHDQKTVDFVLNAPSKAEFLTQQHPCDSTVYLRNMSERGQAFRWKFGDGGQDTTFAPSHTYARDTAYLIRLTVDEGTACADSIERLVHTTPAPRAYFRIMREECGMMLSLVDLSHNAVSWRWTTDDGRVIFGKEASFLFDRSGQHPIKLVVYDKNGCADSLTRVYDYRIDGLDRIYVPNVFSPNGDGVNDKFVITGADASCVQSVMIFDRWGVQVFTSGNVQNAWDGTYDGDQAQEGVFVYVIDVKGEKIVGTVTVLR